MDRQVGLDDVVSHIYRAASYSGSWDAGLAAILDAYDASAVCLRISNGGAKPNEFLFATGRKIRHDILREWEANQRKTGVFSSMALGDVKVCNWEMEFPEQPIVREFREFDVAATLSHCFQVLNGQTYVLSVMRDESGPPFSRREIDALRQIGRHFREATVLRHELVRSNLINHFQAQALDRLGVAGILVDPFGSVTPLNVGAERLLARQEVLKLRRHDQLVAIGRSDDSKLQGYLRKILSGETPEGKTFAMAMEREGGGRPVGMIINSARCMCLTSHREENCALIFVRDNYINSAIDASLVQKLFSFTPAEANLAIGLAAGQRLEEIEGKLNIRHNTARAHLRSMFLKAEVSRQAELVYLLANSVAPLGESEGAFH